MPTKHKTLAKYSVTNKGELLNLLKKENVLDGETSRKKDSGWDIIANKADYFLNLLINKENDSIKTSEGKTFKIKNILPTVTRKTLADTIRKQDSLSEKNMNLLLFLILGSAMYSSDEINSILQFLKPKDRNAVQHFNICSLIISLLLEKKSLNQNGFFWYDEISIKGKQKLDFVLKHSEIIKVYKDKQEAILNLLKENYEGDKTISKLVTYNTIEKSVIQFNQEDFPANIVLEYVDYYKMQLEKFSFFNLLSISNSYEYRIFDDVLGLIKRHFASYNFTYFNDSHSFKRGTNSIDFKWHFVNDSNKYGKILTFLFKSSEEDIICKEPYKAEIDNIGRIREVIIPYVKIPVDIKSLMVKINALISGAYIALENIYLEKAEKFYKHFAKTYQVVANAFKGINKEFLMDKFHLLFADRGKLNSVFYFFDNESIKKLLVFFKKNYSSELSGESPFDHLIDLTTGILPFDKSVGKLSSDLKKPIKIPWLKLPYWNLNKKFAKKEKLMYGGLECVGYAPCEYKDFCLIVACDEKHAKLIMPVISSIKEKLEDELIKTYNFFHSYLLNIKKRLVS